MAGSKLLDSGVDGTALLNGTHNGGEVVVRQDHLRSAFGHLASGSGVWGFGFSCLRKAHHLIVAERLLATRGR